VSYGNQDGASPPDADQQAGTTTVAEAPSESPVSPAPQRSRVPAPAPIGGRSRPIVLLGGATAVLVVLGLVMTGLFVFKSNQQNETSAKLATAQSQLAARDAKVVAARNQLTALQAQLTDAQQRLSGAQQSAASTRTNRQVVRQCLGLVAQALKTARSESASQLDAALKRLKAPCAKANRVA
jgi:hypothetical protein